MHAFWTRAHQGPCLFDWNSLLQLFFGRTLSQLDHSFICNLMKIIICLLAGCLNSTATFPFYNFFFGRTLTQLDHSFICNFMKIIICLLVGCLNSTATFPIFYIFVNMWHTRKSSSYLSSYLVQKVCPLILWQDIGS